MEKQEALKPGVHTGEEIVLTATRKSQRLKARTAHLVTKTERKRKGDSKVKNNSTKKKVAKNDHGKKKSHNTKIKKKSHDFTVKKESCDKEMQESHDIKMKEESFDTNIKVESCNDDKSKVKKKSTKKKIDKNDHIRKKSQGAKVKKESCDKEMQESHDIEMKEESCDTEIKAESCNDDKIFKYDCPVCDKKCKTPNGLTVHISLMHKHFCVHCEKMFSSDEEIKEHLVSHNIITDEEAGEKKYGCEFCDKTYRNIHKLKAHKSTHNIIAMFECDICHKKLKTEGTLSYHKRTVHRDDNEKKFKCEFCGKAFWSRSDMKIHLRMHTNDRPFLCHICSKTFKCSGHLINHNKSIHEDRHWLCHVCGIRFKTKRKYLEHGYTTGHVKEAKPLDVRTWTCEECGKVFARKNDLKIHLRIHSGIKPYQCADCDKAFRCYNHLKQHKVTHTGEKPYECKYCLKRFSQLANVNCHMKKCQYKIRRIVDETKTDASNSDMTTRCSATFEDHGQDGEKKKKIQMCHDKKKIYIAEVESQEDSGNVIPEVQQIADHNDAIEEAIGGILINLQRMKNESSNPNCIADKNDDNIITQQIHIPVDKSSNEDSCQTADSITVVSNAEVMGNTTQIIQINGVSIDEGSINILDLGASEKIIDKGYEILICKAEIPNNSQGNMDLVYDEVEFIDGKCDITEEEHVNLEESYLPKVS